MTAYQSCNLLMKTARCFAAFAALLLLGLTAYAQNGTSIDVNQKLAGFDAFMEKTLKDWNAPGIGVGVVVGDKLVFAKGYVYAYY
jgi:CubicO group peptidase (beta-lactamase class C family)